MGYFLYNNCPSRSNTLVLAAPRLPTIYFICRPIFSSPDPLFYVINIVILFFFGGIQTCPLMSVDAKAKVTQSRVEGSYSLTSYKLIYSWTIFFQLQVFDIVITCMIRNSIHVLIHIYQHSTNIYMFSNFKVYLFPGTDYGILSSIPLVTATITLPSF